MRKGHVKVALLFVLLLATADLTRSTLNAAIDAGYEGTLHDFDVRVVLHLFSCLFTFGTAGALIAKAAIPRCQLPLAIAIGLTAQLMLFAVQQPQPWLARTHGNSIWFELLAWSNWYLPTLSSTLGAVLWIRIGSEARPSDA